MQRLIAFLALMLSSVAFAKEFTWRMIPVDDQQTAFNDSGDHRLYMKDEEAGIFIGAGFRTDIEGDSRATIYISNDSDTQVDFEEKDLRIECSKLPVKIITRAELAKREKRRQAWEGLGLVLAAGLSGYSSANAGYSTSRGTAKGRVSDIYGNSVNVDVDYTERTYDPDAAREQNEAAAQSLSDASEEALEEARIRQERINDYSFRPFTIVSGEETMLDALIELPRKAKARGKHICTAYLTLGEWTYVLNGSLTVD